jgi:hypothetical protein
MDDLNQPITADELNELATLKAKHSNGSLTMAEHPRMVHLESIARLSDITPPAEKKYITVDGETVEDICEQCEKNLFDCECAEPSQDEPEEEETRERITCDQCELLAINGVCCHETRCPNMGARWDAENREWIKQRECFDCGCTVDADDPCCSAPFEDDEPEPEDDEEEEEEDSDTLRSTVDTPEMHDTVLSEARETLERHKLTATFEHGQWWIEDVETGAQWSVVDCESQTGQEYFDFEQVTQGDED